MAWQDKAYELFGEYPALALSRLVGCSKKAAREWINGKRNTPQNVIDDLEKTYEIWRGEL